jgi:hypothetical protein
MKTRDALGVFWRGEEVDGMIFYGYRGSLENPAVPVLNALLPLELWPAGSDYRLTKMFDDGWRVNVWDFKPSEWPVQWRAVVEATLESICEQGASIAWCAVEGMFVDPPWLFLPEEMSGGVYAARSAETGFLCHTDIDEEFVRLTDDQLLRLHRQL